MNLNTIKQKNLTFYFLKNKKKIFLLLSFLFLFIFSASSTSAAFVNCELETNNSESGFGTPCDFCKLLEIINKVINFLLFFVIAPLAVVAFIVAGLFFLFGGTQPNLITKGRKTIIVTVTGTIIAFSAWLAVNTVIDQLGPNNKILWLPWNTIPSCQSEGEPPVPIVKVPDKPPYIPPEPIDNLGCTANTVSQGILDIEACVRSKGVGAITTSKNGGKHTCKLNENPKRISCHYGGRDCNGVGHAIDFGGTNFKKIRDAALDCKAAGAFCETQGGGSRPPNCDNGTNHVHVIDRSDCGCN